MCYDLREEQWIPWRRRTGAVQWGPPKLLLDQLGDASGDPVVAIASPRPDFDAALEEFLIGLLTVALAPADEEAWREIWDEPPTTDAFERALHALPDAFKLDGDNPRFLQDLTAADFEDEEASPVEQLLIDAAGDQGIRLNKDLFVKRHRVERLGRPAAAMALLTMQAYAPAGGKGYRTSMRGGGPLTTLVDPRVDSAGHWCAADQPLWLKLWASVETREQLANRGDLARDRPSDVFPWMGPTRASSRKGDSSTHPQDANPLQAYFGMPRRIRLEFAGPGHCDLTGAYDEQTIIAYRTRNYGVQYSDWNHPLSPYYRSSGTSQGWLPVHGQAGGVGWRDWLGLVMAHKDESRRAAQAVTAFQDRANVLRRSEARLQAVGYDMDNMKARSWTQSAQPVFTLSDDGQRQQLAGLARRLTEGAGIASSALVSAVKNALFQDPDGFRGDLSEAKSELWTATEAPFFETLRALIASDWSAEAETAAVTSFIKVLDLATLATFDRRCPSAGAPPQTIRRIVSARYRLVQTLRGMSKLGEKMYSELGMPLPGGGSAVRLSRSRKRKEKRS